jgi:hypothetical protein
MIRFLMHRGTLLAVVLRIVYKRAYLLDNALTVCVRIGIGELSQFHRELIELR